MLQEPASSPYDLHFSFLGYPVRVAWGFWIVAAILGWGWSGGLNSAAAQIGMDTPGAPVLLLIWIAAVFLSILVHELGHSVAMRYYGTSSRIVLYHFGGLAISDTFTSWSGARNRHIGPQEQIVISAAGPVFQLLLAVLVVGIGIACGIRMDLLGYTIGTEQFPGSAAVYALFDAVLYPSVFWALLNLAPILPLDGGQITKSVLMLTNLRQPTQIAHMVSIGVGALIGFYFLQTGNSFAGIMFLLFAANNWQAMQAGGGGYY